MGLMGLVDQLRTSRRSIYENPLEHPIFPIDFSMDLPEMKNVCLFGRAAAGEKAHMFTHLEDRRTFSFTTRFIRHFWGGSLLYLHLFTTPSRITSDR